MSNVDEPERPIAPPSPTRTRRVDAPPANGGGWISGSARGRLDPPEPDSDPRPAFNPAFLVREVERILTEFGIFLDPDPAREQVAGLAAADLLRALGVSPESAPRRP